VQEVRTLEIQLAKEDAELADFERRESQLTEAFERADGDLAEQIEKLEAEKAAFEKAFESLEGAKANPYREVGRVLADSGVGPMNQPQALAAVRSHRVRMQEYEYALAASEEVTASQNQVELRQSLWIWAGLGLATMAFIIALIALG
jgi:hypothetical protein